MDGYGGNNTLWRGSKHGGIRLSYLYTDWIPALNPWDGLKMLLYPAGVDIGRGRKLMRMKNKSPNRRVGRAGMEPGTPQTRISCGHQRLTESANTAAPPAQVCQFFNGPEHVRDAGGLILHPAERPGEYYRVGVFDSRADVGGGTRLFDGAEEQWICII